MPHEKVRYQIVNLQIGADCSVRVAELVSARWQRLPCANLGAAGEYEVGYLDLVMTFVCGFASHPQHRHDLRARGQHDILASLRGRDREALLIVPHVAPAQPCALA